MSHEVVKEIIQRTKEDAGFLEQLLKNPQQALAGYKLSPEELDFFIQADRQTLSGLSPSCFELANKH